MSLQDAENGASHEAGAHHTDAGARPEACPQMAQVALSAGGIDSLFACVFGLDQRKMETPRKSE